VVALGGTVSTQAGCLEIALLIALTSEDEAEPVAGPDPIAPEVEIDIADWPPIGPNGVVRAHATSPSGLAQADLEFANMTTLWAQGGTEETFEATGAQLGEGLGTLSITVVGNDGASIEQYVDDLLVDLTPPEVLLGPTTLPAQGATFDFWMGDAWVLGKAELSFGGRTLTETLPEGYPATLGTEWDYSLVRFDVAELPAITEVATITLTDAAGNITSESFTLSIDGAPPSASFLAPSAGDELGGTFNVKIEAYDSQPGPLVIDLYAGGTIVATGSGPTCTFVLSGEELGAGPLQLEAIATDEAGNRSVAAQLSVVIAHDAGGAPEEPAPDGE